MVPHVLKQGGKARMVQPVTIEPSVKTKGGIGVVIHLSKQRRNKSIFHPLDRENNKTPLKPQWEIFDSEFKMIYEHF
jgi:hypothetical protein